MVEPASPKVKDLAAAFEKPSVRELAAKFGDSGAGNSSFNWRSGSEKANMSGTPGSASKRSASFKERREEGSSTRKDKPHGGSNSSSSKAEPDSIQIYEVDVVRTITAGTGDESLEDLSSVHVEGVDGLDGMTLEEVEVLWEVMAEEEQAQEQKQQPKQSVKGNEAKTQWRGRDASEEGKRRSPDSKPEATFATAKSTGFSDGDFTRLLKGDVAYVEADVARRKSELAQLETEISQRRGELSKLRVEVANATSEKVQVDSKLRRIKKELRDWSEAEDASMNASTAESEEGSGKAATVKPEVSSAVLRAKITRAREEAELMRNREASVQQDVEYLERKFAQERKENMELRRKLGEAKTVRRDAERELQRLRPEAVLLRKAVAHLQKRLLAEEEDSSLLRQQLQKAQTAELELLEQVQLASRESASLRKASLLAKEARDVNGHWDNELHTQLTQQLQKNADLEIRCAEQKQEVVRLQMKLGQEEKKRTEVQRTLSKLQEGQIETELQQSTNGGELANGEETSGMPKVPKSLSVDTRGAICLPARVLTLLDQVESAKTSGMPEKDELVRLQWLTACLREELLKINYEGVSSISSATDPAAEVKEMAAVKSGRVSGPIGGAQIKAAANKLTQRSLSSVIRLPSRGGKGDKADKGDKAGAETGDGGETGSKDKQQQQQVALKVDIPDDNSGSSPASQNAGAAAPHTDSSTDAANRAPADSSAGEGDFQGEAMPPTPTGSTASASTAAGGSSSKGSRSMLSRWLSVSSSSSKAGAEKSADNLQLAESTSNEEPAAPLRSKRAMSLSRGFKKA